jgi:hypothetical protein
MRKERMQSQHCNMHRKIIVAEGEEIYVYCVEKEYHIYKNLRTLREFVLRDEDGIIKCPEHFDYKEKRRGKNEQK